MDRFEAPPGAAGADLCAERPGDTPDTELIEYEGRTYRIPMALKDAFLRQADYTRKTQDLATDRRALALDRTSFQAGVDAVAAALGQLMSWTASRPAGAAPDTAAQTGPASAHDGSRIQ